MTAPLFLVWPCAEDVTVATPTPPITEAHTADKVREIYGVWPSYRRVRFWMDGRVYCLEPAPGFPVREVQP